MTEIFRNEESYETYKKLAVHKVIPKNYPVPKALSSPLLDVIWVGMPDRALRMELWRVIDRKRISDATFEFCDARAIMETLANGVRRERFR